MLIPKLIPHGERVHLYYAPLPGETAGLVGRSTVEDRTPGGRDGIVIRYQKHEYAARKPCALGWIKSVHDEAIEYTALTKELKGLAFHWGMFSGLGIAPALVGCGIFMMSIGDFKDVFLVVLGASMALASLAFGIYILSTMLRVELFRPDDLPIIFDRKNRSIYRLMREEQLGFFGAFKHWPVMACQYKWDLVDCEHQAQAFTINGSSYTNHFLMFLVRKSSDDPTIIDSFQVSNAASLSSEVCDGMWEHIRRFMEENGPHLPSPQEPLADMTKPLGWWESLGAVGPFGSNYGKFWREHPLYTIFMHFIFPFSVPMFVLWGTGHYLSFKTAFPVRWPDEVLTAIGSRKSYSS